MCMLILDQRDNQKLVPQAVLKRALEKNSDGMGIMYGKNNKLHVWHTMADFQGLWKRYKHARSQKIHVALHFRKGTVGTNSLDNCHPFVINSGHLGLMHNGTMHWLTKSLPKGYSDTRYTAESIIPQLPSDFLKQPALLNLVGHIAGFSRMLFMDNTGAHTIINESGGFWEEDVWYSHSQYRNWMLTGKEFFTAFEQFDELDDRYDYHRDFMSKLWGSKEKKPGKSPKQAKKPAHDQVKSMLVFDYGLLTGPERDSFHMKRLGSARLKGYQLWAVTRPDADLGDPDDFSPAIYSKTDISVLGTVYRVEESPLVGLADIHEYLDGLFVVSGMYIRHTCQVQLTKGDTVQAWSYFGVLTAAELQAPIPHGNWSEWQWADQTVIGSDEAPQVFFCPECGSDDVHDFKGAGDSPAVFLWCVPCKKSYKMGSWVAQRQ